MDTIAALCKRRGFIYPSSDIYGGFNGFFDYGPLGVELKNNIKAAWWQDFVHRRDDIVGLDSAILMHPNIWKASGHVDGFSDPMVDCKTCKGRFRADQLEEENIPCPKKPSCKAGTHSECDLTEPREFNLMFETHVGPLKDSNAKAYLRPETAQGIFANYKNVVDTSRVKMPFGIAQIGKAFRNEITPRNFIFRSREFEQMEIEYFIAPDADWKTLHREWIDACIAWLVSIGVPRELIAEDVHPQDKLAFYSQATTDLTFRFPHGLQELWGIACRSDYDLKQHQEHSGKSMEFFDEEKKERYVPHVIEPSLGVDRTLLAVLTAAYTEDEVPNDKGTPEKRTLLKFHPRIAPYKAAVFPLVKNKEDLLNRAKGLYQRLSRRWPIFWDQSGAIGRRYRRQDEIGTPFGITVDFDTIEKDGTVTVRDRDTTEQQRLSENDLIAYLDEKING